MPRLSSVRRTSRFVVDFIVDRLCRELSTLSRVGAVHHGQVALMIFRGILDGLTIAPPSSRPRLQQAMHDAILRYLEPVLTQTKAAPPRRKGPQRM